MLQQSSYFYEAKHLPIQNQFHQEKNNFPRIIPDSLLQGLPQKTHRDLESKEKKKKRKQD